MVKKILKRMAACLSPVIQYELKRLYFRMQILMRCFKTDEPEYDILGNFISSGDWVIDIGANIGHYTRRFSELVGERGRVIAIEPVPETFSLLAGNLNCGKLNNITLLNVAASDRTGAVGMRIPTFDTGLRNYYESHIANDRPDLLVMALELDSLRIPHSIRLVKIDVEGHQLAVLKGMIEVLEKNHPVIIMERGCLQSRRFLENIDYRCHCLPSSPNLVFLHDESTANCSPILRLLQSNPEEAVTPDEIP